jgi:hypothetical protein
VKSRKTHFDFFFFSLRLWLLHETPFNAFFFASTFGSLVVSVFFAGSFKVHNMFHSYSGGKIIHLISLNRIKRQRVEKFVVQRRAVDDDV